MLMGFSRQQSAPAASASTGSSAASAYDYYWSRLDLQVLSNSPDEMKTALPGKAMSVIIRSGRS